MSDTLFDVSAYTQATKSFTDYDLDTQGWDDALPVAHSRFGKDGLVSRGFESDDLKDSATLNTQQCLTLSQIRRDGGTQPRAKLDLSHVAALVDVLEDGGELDPVTVFYDDESYWLADGFHRCKAHEDFGQEEINCTILQGTQRDAVLFSVGANAEHKAVKPRTREDKRRAVSMLLNDPEWKEWSNYKIAEVCKVSESLVRSLRLNVVRDENVPTRTFTTKHGTTAKMQTGNIGLRPREQGSREALEPDNRGENNNNTTVPHSPLPTPVRLSAVRLSGSAELTVEASPSKPHVEAYSPLPTPPPPSTVRLTLTEANDYLIGFISNIEQMSVEELEEAQRRIDQRLNRQSEVKELKDKLSAMHQFIQLFLLFQSHT
jgi:uncharacterized ParB-like nuclease family protein